MSGSDGPTSAPLGPRLEDGVVRAMVQVTPLGEEFLRGMEGECVVEEFPLVGETVTLEGDRTLDLRQQFTLHSAMSRVAIFE